LKHLYDSTDDHLDADAKLEEELLKGNTLASKVMGDLFS
jgi:hypothetical protein